MNKEMSFVDRWIKKRIKRNAPLRARHMELSWIISQDDAPIKFHRPLFELALREFLPVGGKILTFDIVPWTQFRAALRHQDFEDGSIVQYLEDLSQLETAKRFAADLNRAELIFIDAAKDGIQEQRFLDNFRAIGLHRKPILFFDDIRLWNMLRIWREIQMPKLDLTGFGHWSGSGIVQWE